MKTLIDTINEVQALAEERGIRIEEIRLSKDQRDQLAKELGNLPRLPGHVETMQKFGRIGTVCGIGIYVPNPMPPLVERLQKILDEMKEALK